MMKLIKYELIRDRMLLAIMAIVLGGSELVYLFGIWTKNNWTTGRGAAFVIFGAGAIFFTILVQTGLRFTRDLRTRERMTVFHTPVSPVKIILARALMGFFELVLTGTIACWFISLDISLLDDRFPTAMRIFKTILSLLGLEVDGLMGWFGAFIAMQIFTMLTYYVGICFISTVMAVPQRTGMQVLAGLAATGGVMGLVSIIRHLPQIMNSIRNAFWFGIVGYTPRILFALLCVIGLILGTGRLLDKKVSF